MPDLGARPRAKLFTLKYFVHSLAMSRPDVMWQLFRFKHLLSNCTCAAASSDGHGASQPVDTSSRKHTFERVWRLRSSEMHVLAMRADSKCHASKKKLVLADTTLFATLKEPQGAIQEGDEIKHVLGRYACIVLRRTMPFQATRTIRAFSGCL